MKMSESIARWICPDLGRRADYGDWLISEISYEARWLSEFPFVARTLDRMLDKMYDWFRPVGVEAKCKEPDAIWNYRELLRLTRDFKQDVRD